MSVVEQELRDTPRIWLAAIAIAIALLGGLEALWRSRGYLPSQGRMDAALMRFNLRQPSPDTIVVAGDSSAMAAVSLAGLETCTNRTATNVGCYGCNPLVIAEHVASSSTFGGVILLEVDDSYGTADDESGRGQLDEAMDLQLLDRIDARLELPLDEYVVFRNNELALVKLVRHLLEPADEWLPFPRHNMRVNARNEILMYPDTKPENDARRAITRAGPAAHTTKPFEPAELDQLITRYGLLGDRLRSRGGRLVLVLLPRMRPPTSPLWDRLHVALPAVDMVDASHPSPEVQDGFDHSPDRAFGTHLVATMRDRFTQELCKSLEAIPSIHTGGP